VVGREKLEAEGFGEGMGGAGREKLEAEGFGEGAVGVGRLSWYGDIEVDEGTP
jgi:hypothetical protein